VTASTEPIGKLPPQEWLDAPETKAVVAALTAGGVEVRFVGGCVRDALARKPVVDIDIGTPARPEQVMDLLKKAGIRAIPTGIDHGTVTALSGERKYEITTLRVDVETDGRHARVRYTDDWYEDAKRRDFTINALSCTPNGDVFDFFNGLDALGHGRILFVGRAKDRIEEDLLRLLRYFRFFGTHGRPPPDIEALNACRDLAPRLGELSGERVRDELFKILLCPIPADILNLMRGERVIECLFPGVAAENIGRVRLVAWLESNAMKQASVRPDPVRRLAALLTTDQKGAESVAERLKLSNAERERVVKMAAPPEKISLWLDAAAQRRKIYELGAETVRDLALLSWANELAIAPRQPQAKANAWKAMLAQTEEWTAPALPVSGEDVMALGIASGPEVGKLLKAVEAWWIEGDFQTDRQKALAKLRELASP
jgi:poly(A) polymerase